MDLILFFTRTYLFGFLTKKRDALEYLGLGMITLMLIGQSIQFGRVIDQTEGHLLELFKLGVLGIPLLIPFLGSVFPGYEQLRQCVPTLYPVNNVKRFILNMVGEWISASSFLVILGLSLITVNSEQINWTFILIGLITLQSGIALKRLFHAFVERKKQFSSAGLILLLAGISLLAGGSLGIIQFGWSLELNCGLISLGLTIANYATESYLIQPDTKRSFSASPFRFSTQLSLLSSKRSIISLLMGLLYKILMLFIIASKLEKSSELLFIVMLFVSPIFIFNYFYNNSWGHLREYWYLLQNSNGNAATMFKAHIRLLMIPLIIDALITFGFLWYTQVLLFNGTIMYLTSVFLMMAISFLSSTFLPLELPKSLNLFKPTVNMGASFLSVAVIGSLTLLEVVSWYIYILPAYFILGGILYWYAFTQYHTGREKLFLKLFKE